MLGIPSKELKDTVDAIHERVKRCDAIIEDVRVTAQNARAISDDIRAITGALRMVLGLHPQ